MLLASFDIGEKNFAYSIGEYKEGKLIIIKVAHHNLNNKNKQTILESCINASIILNNDDMLMACDQYIIEQQMRSNTRAQRLAQHLWSTLYTMNKIVSFVPSHLKTQYFIGKNKLNSKERKKWSVVKVTKEKVMGEECDSIVSDINKLKKKDDVCDTILQLIAYVNRSLQFL
jgi:hypothetical protein